MGVIIIASHSSGEAKRSGQQHVNNLKTLKLAGLFHLSYRDSTVTHDYVANIIFNPMLNFINNSLNIAPEEKEKHWVLRY